MDAVCHPQTGTILMSPTRDERFLFQRKRFPLDISDSGDMGTVEVAERYGLTVNICVLSGSLFCFLSMSPNTGIWALYYEQKMERFFSRESLEPKKKKKILFLVTGGKAKPDHATWTPTLDTDQSASPACAPSGERCLDPSPNHMNIPTHQLNPLREREENTFQPCQKVTDKEKQEQNTMKEEQQRV